MGAGVVALIVCAVLLFIGVFWYFSADAVIRRTLRNAQTVAVSEFQPGTAAKLVGRLSHTGQTLTAPLSGRSCAYYQVTVEEYRSNGKSGSWYTVVDESEGAGFLLQDDSGQALVHLQAAKVVVVKDSHSKSGTFDDATEAEEAFLQRHGKKSQGWVFNKKLRYREGVLEEGETVAVFGHGEWDANPDPSAPGAGYRGTSKRLVMRTNAQSPLYVSDDSTTLR